MSAELNVKPYDITNGEKVTYGYYSALEVVFKQFIKKLETYFYDEFKLTLEFEYKIKTDIKFINYLNSHRRPLPFFVFGITPLMRDAFIKFDNRFINLLLNKDSLFKTGRVALHDGFSIDKSNGAKIKDSVEELLSMFQDSWTKIHPVECSLRKLVSNKIKAKIMDDSESCVVITVSMKQRGFNSNWDICLSRYQLDRIIEKRGAKGLLASTGTASKEGTIKTHLTELLMNESEYEIRGVLGSLDLSSKDLLDSFQSNSVIPISNQIKHSAIVQLNRIPILAAEIGETYGNLAVQIKNRYDTVKEENKKEQKSFKKIEFSKL